MNVSSFSRIHVIFFVRCPGLFNVGVFSWSCDDSAGAARAFSMPQQADTMHSIQNGKKHNRFISFKAIMEQFASGYISISVPFFTTICQV